jgi:D-glycero-D-manno-heptose 1,7-bisphosphate phosphatase
MTAASPTPQRALFLDRDGVINRRIAGDYVRRADAFEFLPGAPAAVARLARCFHPVVVVTNQAGVGRGFMTLSDLEAIHSVMLDAIGHAGGRIDGIFVCPHAPDAGCPCRKPRTGLAEQARQAFPEIDFSGSVLVGDGESDIAMGAALGMTTVLVAAGHPATSVRPDAVVASLAEAASLLCDGAMRP